MDLSAQPIDCSSELAHGSPSTLEPDVGSSDDHNTSINIAEPQEELESLDGVMPSNGKLIFADGFDEETAEFSEPIFTQRVEFIDKALVLQREEISALQQAIDREGRDLDNRKKLIKKAKEKREALIELRGRIVQRIDDEDNDRFLDESLVGIELAV